MNTKPKKNKDKQQLTDADSVFLGVDNLSESLDFGGLFSPQFTNITPIYSSPNGAAEIYLATRYGKRFILKGLKEQYREDPIYTIALAKEFEIGMMLDHPYIRRTLGLETVENIGMAIILEYVDGCSLERLLTSGNLTSSSARSIAAQLADALRYIHSKQVFHRDLKPSNILVSHNGNVVKIIDFNLSDSDDYIILKNPAGSKKYMAPEQLRPDARPSAAADIYSFGVVVDELACAAGDTQLAQAAQRFMNYDPEKRPKSVDMVRLPDAHPSLMECASDFLSSATLTYIMSGICLALAAAIALMLGNNG